MNKRSELFIKLFLVNFLSVSAYAGILEKIACGDELKKVVPKIHNFYDELRLSENYTSA